MGSEHGPAEAQQIVAWYAHRPGVGLGLLLITLPGVAFLLGLSVLAGRRSRSGVAPGRDGTAWVATAGTIVAGVILTIVGLHVLAN